MQIGMIGLGRMGANMVCRLNRAGHQCVVFDRSSEAVQTLAKEGMTPAMSVQDLVNKLSAPRAIWLMLPAAVVDASIAELAPLLSADDIIIDGGNSYYKDDIVRAKSLSAQSIHYADVGVSGGTWGLERGYCLMVGAQQHTFARLQPIFAALAPGVEAAPRTEGCGGQPSTAEIGYLHCGPEGAGHFVKMVHNGIEYGMMQSLAEGFALLQAREDFNIDLAAVAELWRHGSVVRSWLLDLCGDFLKQDQQLDSIAPVVADSGEGRWTALEAIEQGIPAPVMSLALMMRFASQGKADFGDKMLAKMREGFGGHAIQSDKTTGATK